MQIFKSWMQKKPSVKTVAFWNMMGSLVNAAVSVLLLMMVTRTLGDEKAGIFSLGFSVSLMMLTVGMFEVRPFQSTDIYKQFSFSAYFTFRILTCAGMLLVTAVYLLFNGYSGEKAWVIVLLCLLKCTEAFCDVFNGQAQQNDRLDVAGFSLSVRVFVYCAGFLVSLLVTKNLLISCGVMVVLTLLWLTLFDAGTGKYFEKCRIVWDKTALFGLFKSCFPLFLASFLMMYINNAPKFAVDAHLSAEYQTYYGIIFMPASVINLFSLFAFRPLLTKLTAFWNEHKCKAFLSTVAKLVLWILAVTAAALLGGWLLGIPLLSLLYGTDLSVFKSELMVVLAGGGFNALCVLLYYMITVQRKQKYVLIGYVGASVTAWILGDRMVSAYGMMGASLTYLLSVTLLCLLFVFIFIGVLANRKKGEKQVG
ncbi:MAG: lipopolysaccharide biosynthesis protein [Lachnospiraceae bacterium]